MRRVFAVLIGLSFLAAPVAAQASGRDVVRDCTDNGRIDSYHSQGDYDSAAKRLPSDVDEYTDCRAIIQSAKRRDARRQAPGGGGGGGSGGGGGGISSGFDTPTPPPAANVPAAPRESSALSRGAKGGGPVSVAGEPIVPGGSGIRTAALRHDLPGPLLAALILLALGVVAMTISGARARGAQAPTAVLRVFDRVFPHRD